MTDVARTHRRPASRRVPRTALAALRAMMGELAHTRGTLRARFQRTLRLLAGTLPAERCTLALYSERTRTLRIVATHGPAGPETPGIQAAFRAGRPVNASTGEAELHVPLDGPQGRPAGVLSAYRTGTHPFGHDEEALLDLVAERCVAAWQHVRLLRRARRRAAEIQTLHAATMAMISGLSREQVLEKVARQLIQALEVQGACLLRTEPAPAGRLRVLLDLAPAPHAHCHARGEEIDPALYPTIARALVASHPAMIHRDDPYAGAAELRQLEVEGAEALLAVPLLARGEAIGVALLRGGRGRRGFPAHAIRLAQMIANQAAAAIENARFYEQATQMVTELTALRETALDLASQLDMRQVLERAVERASHLLGARGGVLFLAEEDGATLRVAISHVPWADYTGQTVALGQGLAGRVAQTGQPALVNDYQHWPGRAPEFSGQAPTAALCIPLRWAGRVLGVLDILDDQPGRGFTRDDLELLAQLGPQAGLSIRNAQLYAELERRVEELRRAQAQLVRSEKLAALGRLAGSIAHEVNNPLQSLQNCLELCQRPAVTAAKRREYLLLAQEEVERVVVIVQRLLDFYRPAQEGRMAVQVNDVVQDVLALASKRLEQARVRVEHALDPALPRLEAIPAHLKQVFLNLILNAMEAMPGGGRLHVTTRYLAPGWLAIDFADEGAGIATADLPKIFEPFFTSKTKGSGLGLSVSYGIVQAHGGTIEVRSEVGAGSVFTVRLPLPAAGRPAMDGLDGQPAATHGGT